MDLGKYKGKVVTLPWSGGLDSTMLLLGLLDAGVEEVRTIAFTGGQLPNPEHEKFARETIRDILGEAGYKVTHREVELPPIRDGHWPNSFAYAQHTMWMQMLPMVVSEHTDVVLMGYISTDGFIPFIEDMKKHWIAGNYNYAGNSFPELHFPIKKLHKYHVIDSLLTLAEKLKVTRIRDFVTFCHQTFKAGNFILRCGECSNCKSADSKGTGWLQQTAYVTNDQRITNLLFKRVDDYKDGELFDLEYGDRYQRFLKVKMEEGDGPSLFLKPKFKEDLSKITYALVYIGEHHEPIKVLKKLPTKSIVLNQKELDQSHAQGLLEYHYSDPRVKELLLTLRNEENVKEKPDDKHSRRNRTSPCSTSDLEC